MYREKLTKKGYSYRSGWKGRSGGGTGKSEFRDKSEDKCFKCGETGHWASKCKGSNIYKKKHMSHCWFVLLHLHVSRHILVNRKYHLYYVAYLIFDISQVELLTS